MLPAFVLSFTDIVKADECKDGSVGLDCTASEAKITQNDPAVFIGTIIKALFTLLGVIILIFVLYGGYLWLVSAGNEEMIKKSKGILTNSVIGLIIVLGSFVIVDFLMKNIKS